MMHIADFKTTILIRGSGVHRPPEGQGRNGVTRGGGTRFTILSRFFVILVFLFCKLFEHYSQTNFPIIKTAFQGNKILKSMADI